MSRYTCVLGLLCVLFSSTAVSANLVDRTDTVLEKIRAEKGLRELEVTDAAGLKLHLDLEGGAEKIINERQFDVEDKDFDEAKFRAFVLERITAGVTYFRAIVTRDLFTDFHVVIEDLGEARKTTISQTAVGSRVLRLDVRRWHKLYKGYRAYLADVTSIHEFTHAVNYFVDEGETKKHRELAAVAFESLAIYKPYGAALYKKNYLKKVSGPVKKPEDVLGDDYHGMPALRATMHSLISKLIDGVYRAEGEKLAVVERFAAAYLLEPEHGAEGFNRALKAAGITDGEGKELTLERVQLDLFGELKAKPGVPVPNSETE